MAEGEPAKIRPKRSPKRKRAESFPVTFSSEEKLEKIDGFRSEIESLVKFCKQFVLENRGALLEYVEKHRNVALNSVVACLMEESHLPLSKLVDDIFDRFELGNWGVSVTKASVKNVVLTIGQRLHYGVIDADTDVLEDEAESALWCWEVYSFSECIVAS